MKDRDWKEKKYSLEDVFKAMDTKGSRGVVVAMCEYLNIELWQVGPNDEAEITEEGKEIQDKLKEIRNENTT